MDLEPMFREPPSTTENWRLFLQCSDSIARYIRRRVRDAEEAAEIFQDLSLIVLKHENGPLEVDRFASWCRGLARHTLAHHFRSKRRRATLLDRAELEGSHLVGQGPYDPEHSFAARELLDRMFQNVDERSRRMMIDRYLLGKSAEEIGQRLAQSPTSIRMKLMRVRGAVMRTRPRAESWPDIERD